jgi:type I restriction enzyme, R subunit
LEQVKEYGRKLHIRRVYSSNGQKIYEFDLEQGVGAYVEQFPSPQELYERIIDPAAHLRQKLLAIPYFLDSNKKPRYYQDIAVSTALTAIAQGNQRILLTLATGTGKTFIAFQLAYKLFIAKRSREGINRRPRILFLADRNILIEQAMNTFNPLEKDILWITGKEIKKRHGIVPSNANIFFAIYQAIIA